MAITIINFPAVTKDSDIVGTPQKVFAIAVKMKPMTNQGNTLMNENLLSPPLSSVCFAFRAVYIAKINVMGTIINVLVSFTMVAKARAVLSPAALLQAVPAATTDDVSFMAVPDHIPKPISLIPKRCPNAGKINTATILKRKMVDIACATSSSLALITGAVAAIADPPQTEVPIPIKVVMFVSSFIALPTKYATKNEEERVKTRIIKDWLPTAIT